MEERQKYLQFLWISIGNPLLHSNMFEIHEFVLMHNNHHRMYIEIHIKFQKV